MKKYQIKKMLQEMIIDESMDVFTGNFPRQQNTIKKLGYNEYSIFSRGQNWSDQIQTFWDFKQITSFLWNSKIKTTDII